MNETARPRYRFGEIVLSPGRRLLLRGGEEIALPPRYLDLLILLVAERHRVVSRDEIHQLVWGGVAVTDGAFTQAVRTLRRALGDDEPRQPRFIRTVSRHGYQFVATEVVEEPDGPDAEAIALPPAMREESAVETRRGEVDRGGLAEVVGATLGATGGALAASLLLGSLLVVAGGGGWRLLPVLCFLGALVGAWGGVTVGGGIVLARALGLGRAAAAIVGAALGGAVGGAVAHALAGWTMSELLGQTPTALGGAFEGVVIGAACGLGLALARSGETLAPVLTTAVAAALLAVAGSRLPSTSLDAIAGGLHGIRLLAPLGSFLGERGAGPATRLAVGLLEGGFFAAGVAAGLARARPRTVAHRALSGSRGW